MLSSVAFDTFLLRSFNSHVSGVSTYLLILGWSPLQWRRIRNDQPPLLALMDLKLFPFPCFPFYKWDPSTYNKISSFYSLVLLSLECIFLGSPWKGSFIFWITLKDNSIVQGPACMGILQLMEDVSVELSGKMSLSFFKLLSFYLFRCGKFYSIYLIAMKQLVHRIKIYIHLSRALS